MKLIDKRAELIAEHQAHEKVPESPWSPKHAAMKAKLDAGEQLLSERPIAFICDDEIVVVGECVPKILEGLQKFLNLSAEDEHAATWTDRRSKEPVVAQAFAKVEKLLATDPPEEIRVHQQTWNAYLFALNEAGVHVVLTDGKGLESGS